MMTITSILLRQAYRVLTDSLNTGAGERTSHPSTDDESDTEHAERREG